MKERKMKRTTGKHISVTLDLLRTFNDLDITKEADLHVALYRVGFDAEKNDVTGKVVGLQPFTMLTDKNVRCANKPYMCRRTIIFVGNMRPGFKEENIYRNIDILDVKEYNGSDAQLVSDLPYDLPVADKVNTRKYTKRADRNGEVPFLEFTNEDEDRLEGILYGQGAE